MPIITPAYLNNLQNLYNSGVYEGLLNLVNPVVEDEYAEDDDIFQILICKPPNPSYPAIDEKMDVELVYGSKSTLKEKYGVTDLPSTGVKVEPSFGVGSPGQQAGLRFLMLCRKISQIVAYTWIDLPQAGLTQEQKEISIIRGIFDTFNISPTRIIFIDDTSLEMTEQELKAQLVNTKYSGKLSNIIKPSYANYTTIRLALLLGGQAYYQNENDDPDQKTYSKVGASIDLPNGIYSTYEIIWKQALTLSWDAFHSVDQDISQAGLNQRPPATILTIGYPPRPSEFNVTQKRIDAWATAPLEEGAFPFYPPKETEAWRNGTVKFFAPPFPYLPTSSS